MAQRRFSWRGRSGQAQTPVRPTVRPTARPPHRPPDRPPGRPANRPDARPAARAPPRPPDRLDPALAWPSLGMRATHNMHSCRSPRGHPCAQHRRPTGQSTPSCGSQHDARRVRGESALKRILRSRYLFESPEFRRCVGRAQNGPHPSNISQLRARRRKGRCPPRGRLPRWQRIVAPPQGRVRISGSPQENTVCCLALRNMTKRWKDVSSSKGGVAQSTSNHVGGLAEAKSENQFTR